MKTNIYSVDFADLRTLILVYEYRSFTKAAVSLAVNQSAVSYTIDKLRRHFGDPLFVRLGGGISPTDRCNEIVDVANELLDDFESIALPRSFAPATTVGKITIACNFFERQLIFPSVLRTLRKDAPGLVVEVISSTSEGDNQLKHSEASLLIGPLVPDETGFYCRKLLDDHYVCVMDKDNALASGDLSVDSYLACNHTLVTYGGSWKSRFLTDLENRGLALNNVLLVPSPAGLPDLIRGTDLVATVPFRIAALFGDNFSIVDSPFPSPFEIHLVWTERTHMSALHRWLRDLIFTEVRRAA